MYRYRNNSRSIVAIILLTFFTFGLYELYWIASTTNDLRRFNQDFRSVSGGMTVFLIIITFGLYGFYWWYKIGKMFVDSQRLARFMHIRDNTLIYFLLALFSFGFVSMLILQSDLNDFWRELDYRY